MGLHAPLLLITLLQLYSQEKNQREKLINTHLNQKTKNKYKTLQAER